MSAYSEAMLEALAIAGAEWELTRGGCRHRWHTMQSIVVSRDEPQPELCPGCGGERPLWWFRLVVVSAADLE